MTVNTVQMFLTLKHGLSRCLPSCTIGKSITYDFSFVNNDKQFYHEPVIADMESNKFQS